MSILITCVILVYSVLSLSLVKGNRWIRSSLMTGKGSVCSGGERPPATRSEMDVAEDIMLSDYTSNSVSYPVTKDGGRGCVPIAEFLPGTFWPYAASLRVIPFIGLAFLFEISSVAALLRQFGLCIVW
jgi:hypothetical protein